MRPYFIGMKNMIEKITSLTNEKIKLATSLKEKKYRDEYGLFVGEGVRFAEMAINSDFETVSVFFEAKLTETERGKILIESLQKKAVNIYEVAEKNMKKIANTKTPQGVFIIIKQKRFSFSDVKSANFIVVLDEVKDPGNVGAIIRLADAVGAGGVVLLKNSADAYSDKVVRASMGSVFNIPVLQNIDKRELLNFAKEQNLKVYATKMSGVSCYEKDFKGGGIFVFGSESEGVSAEILNAAENISLPMKGKAESLNVATAASAVLYEVLRQNGDLTVSV